MSGLSLFGYNPAVVVGSLAAVFLSIAGFQRSSKMNFEGIALGAAFFLLAALAFGALATYGGVQPLDVATIVARAVVWFVQLLAALLSALVQLVQAA